jgi:hypothetical protein
MESAIVEFSNNRLGIEVAEPLVIITIGNFILSKFFGKAFGICSGKYIMSNAALVKIHFMTIEN